MQEVNDVVVCEYCDTVHQKVMLKPRQRAQCKRCYATLNVTNSKLSSYLLPLTIAALVLFLIANCFPILEIQVQGKASSVTLIGSLYLLNQEGASLVSGLIMLTTILSPLVHLSVITYAIYGHRTQQNLPGIHFLIRLLQQLLPWGMIEVFMLGILVAIIKLSSLATIIFGVALWAFIGLSILMALIISFDVRVLWHINGEKKMNAIA